MTNDTSRRVPVEPTLEEFLALAELFDAGTAQLIASDYMGYISDPALRHRAIISAALRRASTPDVAGVGSLPTVEEIARVLVPFALGAFERQFRSDDGKWENPPFTPNDNALTAARSILAILARRGR